MFCWVQTVASNALTQKYYFDWNVYLENGLVTLIDIVNS